jgi:hypothetical protein
MTDATLDTTVSRPAVRLERYLPDPQPVVWAAIIDQETAQDLVAAYATRFEPAIGPQTGPPGRL